MFNTVTDRSATLIPRGQYQVKVVSLEEAPSQLYDNVQVKWVFNVAEQNGKPLVDGGGRPIELWQFTSKNLTKHPKNKTRPWLEALLGRDLKDGESGGPLAEEVIGKKALCFIDQQPSQNGNVRNVIQSMWRTGSEQPAASVAAVRENEDTIPF